MTVTNNLLNTMYGKENVDAWADTENKGNAQHIQARRSWAITRATNHVTSWFRAKSFDLTEALATEDVIHITAVQAIVFLYGPRVSNDSDSPEQATITAAKKEVRDFFKAVATGTLKLGAKRTVRDYPGVVTEDTEVDSTIAD